ncbi:MAG: response regulator transcription factor [Endomicrobium sp.]|jgi:two-component system alkaline phosphatase synthesis response regulator PhoP|nr:response regulator transcription factor [Endomicrobium sp.]
MIENTIIVVDDEKDVQHLLKDVLENEKFKVIPCQDTECGYKKIIRYKPTLVLLDINVPTIGGIELCKKIRETPEIKNLLIIMLTIESTEKSKIIGFEVGADDYITKPFSNRELVVRIHSLLRRVRRHDKRYKMEYDGLVMDLDAKEVVLNKNKILLRPKEFELLRMFLLKPNTVLYKDFILENIFEYNNKVSTRTIDTHIKNLRHSLGFWGKHIETVFGIGFKFVTDQK